MDDKVNLANEISEVFAISKNEYKICNIECTKELYEFMQRHGENIINHAKQLYYKEERNKREQGVLF